MFKPSSGKGCPVPTSLLSEVSTSFLEFEDGTQTTERNKWRSRTPQAKPLRSWRGRTEFRVNDVANPEVLQAFIVGSDEVKTIPAEDAERWRDADAAEWEKVEATGAIRELSLEESAKVLQELTAAKLDRSFRPGWFPRNKPGELPTEPSSLKSRLCIRGDCDPDVFSLDRHAPTASSLTLAIAMQVCATRRWRASVGDLRNALCQSEALHRKAGRLFARQPDGRLRGLDRAQLRGLKDRPTSTEV